jgi:hypothetical protein
MNQTWACCYTTQMSEKAVRPFTIPTPAERALSRLAYLCHRVSLLYADKAPAKPQAHP